MKQNNLFFSLYKNNKIQTLFRRISPQIKYNSLMKKKYNFNFLRSDVLYWNWWVKNEKMERGCIPMLYKKITTGRGKTAFDVGCGNGFYSEILRDNGYDVICADRCENALKIVMNKGFKFKKIDINNFSIDVDEHYDVISCMGVLHHIVDDVSVKNALNMMNKHCDFLVLGVRNDLEESYKFKHRPLSFYADIVKGEILQTDSYLDIILN